MGIDAGPNFVSNFLQDGARFGYMPQGAINMLKDLGLNIFMVSVGLAAGGEIIDVVRESGAAIIML